MGSYFLGRDWQGWLAQKNRGDTRITRFFWAEGPGKGMYLVKKAVGDVSVEIFDGRGQNTACSRPLLVQRFVFMAYCKGGVRGLSTTNLRCQYN